MTKHQLKVHVHTADCVPPGTPTFTRDQAVAKLHELGFVEVQGQWHHADGTVGRLSCLPVCYQMTVASTDEGRGYWLQPAAKRAPTAQELMDRVPTLPASIPLIGETL